MGQTIKFQNQIESKINPLSVWDFIQLPQLPPFTIQKDGQNKRVKLNSAFIINQSVLAFIKARKS